MFIDENYFKDEEFKRNLESYEESVKSGLPIFMDVDDLTDIIDYYNYNNEVEKALKAADYTLSIYPGAVGPLVFMSRLALEAEDYDKAENFAEQIEDKSDIDYFFLMTEIQVGLDNIEEADAFATKGYENADDDEAGDYILDVGNLFVEYFVFDKAEKWLSLYKGEENIDYLRLACRCAIGKSDFDTAEIAINKLIDIDPYNYMNWNFLAGIQLDKEKYSEALSSSEYSLAISPGNQAGLFYKARGLYHLENYEEAIKYFERSLEKHPDDSISLRLLGECQVQIGETREGISNLKKALLFTPEDSLEFKEINTHIAIAYASLNEPDNAVEYYKNSLMKDINAGSTDLFKAHAMMVDGKLDEALEAFFRVITQTKFNVGVFKSIMSGIVGNGHYDMGYKFFNRVKPHLPEDCYECSVLMGICCIGNDKFDEYEKYMKLAIEHNPDEVKEIMANIIPDDAPVSEYMSHIINFVKNRKK